ncbi:MAG: peptidase M3, partial [Rikenellaceae bacterium]
MKKTLLMTLSAATLALSGCGEAQVEQENPFFTEWNTPFGVPPFDKIQNQHFLPAYEKAMAQEVEEIKAIVENTEAPTFENTILPYS